MFSKTTFTPLGEVFFYLCATACLKTMEWSIPIHLKGRTRRGYTITIRPGIFRELPRILREIAGDGDLFIITDSTVGRLYGRDLLRRMNGRNTTLLMFPPGERSKRARIVEALYAKLLRRSIARNALLVALGGGVVGDVAGFVAATILRGVRFVQVPTTLLAQVDSSVGGKVGIDHPHGKNLIGAFYHPAAVLVDPEVLGTLPEVEIRNGLAEIVKIAAALDANFFRRIERNAGRNLRGNPGLLGSLIADAVGLKAAVVRRDEFESHLRKALNLGHTIGHAIEASSAYGVPHGAAIAMGIAAESRIAARLGILAREDCERLFALMRLLRLPLQIPSHLNRKKFVTAFHADKKSVQHSSRFVLLNGIGRCVIGVPVQFELVAEVCGLRR